jgi:hypothetical protein
MRCCNFRPRNQSLQISKVAIEISKIRGMHSSVARVARNG